MTPLTLTPKHPSLLTLQDSTVTALPRVPGSSLPIPLSSVWYPLAAQTTQLRPIPGLLCLDNCRSIAFPQAFPCHASISCFHSRPDILGSWWTLLWSQGKAVHPPWLFVPGSMSSLGSRPTAQHLLNYLNLPQRLS